MEENNQKKAKHSDFTDNKKSEDKSNNDQKDEKSIEEKLADSEDKLLRSLAEIENQRRRSKKKLKMHLNSVLLILLKKAWLF